MLENRLFFVLFISSNRIGKIWCQSQPPHVLNGHKEASYCPTSSNSELFKYEKNTYIKTNFSNDYTNFKRIMPNTYDIYFLGLKMFWNG